MYIYLLLVRFRSIILNILMKITVKCGVKDKHVLINEMPSIIITIIIVIIDLKILSRPYKFSDQ